MGKNKPLCFYYGLYGSLTQILRKLINHFDFFVLEFYHFTKVIDPTMLIKGYRNSIEKHMVIDPHEKSQKNNTRKKHTS